MVRMSAFGPVSRNPRLRTTEVLRWLYKTRPDGFTIKDVTQQFDVQRGDAQRRVNYLRTWGTVRVVGKLSANRRGRREIQYALTKWGKTYCARSKRTPR